MVQWRNDVAGWNALGCVQCVRGGIYGDAIALSFASAAIELTASSPKQNITNIHELSACPRGRVLVT